MKPRKIKCPRCGETATYSPENPFRPFCSKRCRLIDLGEWADEGYKIPSQSENPEDLENDLPPEGQQKND